MLVLELLAQISLTTLVVNQEGRCQPVIHVMKNLVSISFGMTTVVKEPAINRRSVQTLAVAFRHWPSREHAIVPRFFRLSWFA